MWRCRYLPFNQFLLKSFIRRNERVTGCPNSKQVAEMCREKRWLWGPTNSGCFLFLCSLFRPSTSFFSLDKMWMFNILIDEGGQHSNTNCPSISFSATYMWRVGEKYLLRGSLGLGNMGSRGTSFSEYLSILQQSVKLFRERHWLRGRTSSASDLFIPGYKFVLQPVVLQLAGSVFFL